MGAVRVNVVSESAFGIQGHGVHTAYLEHIACLEKRSDVSVVTNSRKRSDIVHIHTVGAYSLGKLLFSAGKKVVSAHVIPESFVGSLVGAQLWAPLAKWYLHWFYSRADAVIAVSDDTKKNLIAMGVKKPVHVVYNSIDTTKYATSAAHKKKARSELGITADAWVVIGAGQVQPRKRIDSFIDTATKLPDMRFIWVGGMPFGKVAADHSAMSRLMESPPENVTFSGIVPFEEMRKYYQAADVFFLPSAQETFGLVVVEAAAAGLPVILRDIPDYAETFKGDVVMADDATFVAELTKLRSDQAYYTKLKSSAKRIATRYDSKAGAEVLTTLYKSLLQ
jgi:1,2-diacylglycerol-3-alpha-glucose alpha-1,2-galactosyltransferase